MTWDLVTAKAKIGLSPTDTTQDFLLQTSLDTALALAEKYCDRFFLQATESVKFYHTHYDKFQLRRYPIQVVNKVSEAGDFKVHGTVGWLEFDRPVIAEELQIDYVGGYAVLPNDLELALWGIFDNVYANFTASGGATVSGSIKKLAITGVGSVDYDTSSGTTVNLTGGFGGLIPAMGLAILELYRLESA